MAERDLGAARQKDERYRVRAVSSSYADGRGYIDGAQHKADPGEARPVAERPPKSAPTRSNSLAVVSIASSASATPALGIV